MSKIPPPDDSIPGMRIAPQDPAAGYLLIIRSKQQQPWRIFPPAPYEVATAILYKEEYFRIDKFQQMPEGDWVYWLNRWPDAERTTGTVNLTPGIYASEKERLGELETYRRSRAYAIPLELATGWLPHRIQERISMKHATNPERATVLNCVPIVAIMGLSAFLVYGGMRAAMSGMPVSPIYFICMPLALYCAIDAFVRVGTVVAADRSMGLLFLEAIDYLYVRFILRD